MQKIKNILHHNKDDTTSTTGTHTTTTPARTSDPIVHDHGIPIPNTLVAGNTVAPMGTNVHTGTSTATGLPHSGAGYDSLDKNKDGRVDAADFQGKGTSTTHHNPLDRNHDGKVNLKDLKPSAKREAPINDQKLAALDRNHDGVVDARDFQGQQGMGLAHGNPLDRNGDGRVDARDFQGQQGMGLAHRNPLDRNGDGRVDARDFQGQQTGLTTVRSEPTQIQVVEKGVVVHEHIHALEKEEIQPVIHREREQLEVKQITQQLHETQIQPTLVQHRELAPEVRAPIVERGIIEENVHFSTVDRDATMRSVQVNQPILEETVKKTVIEEIQPVLERDVFVPTIVQQTQNIYEKVVEAPTVYREVLPVRELGTTRSEAYIPHQEPIVMREVAAPVAPVQNFVAPITVTTTTTTTDSFVPAKLVHDGQLGNTVVPSQRKVL
jgi:hypothetical protein